MWLLYDALFLIVAVATVGGVVWAFSAVHEWWFRSGHPCRKEMETSRGESCPFSVAEEYRKTCPRHNPVTAGRHDRIGMALFFVTTFAGALAVFELYWRYVWWR